MQAVQNPNQLTLYTQDLKWSNSKRFLVESNDGALVLVDVKVVLQGLESGFDDYGGDIGVGNDGGLVTAGDYGVGVFF